MAGRWFIALAIAAIAAAGVWLYLNGRPSAEPARPAPSGDRPLAPVVYQDPQTGKTAPHVPPPPPRLAGSGGTGSGGPQVTQVVDGRAEDAAFEAQDRDSTWAPATEDALRTRLANLPGVTVTPECRRTQCRIVLSDIELTELGRAIGMLESPRGLRGFATSDLLGTPTKRADGTFELHVFASFDR